MLAGENSARLSAVREKADDWVRLLVELSARNPLLRYRDYKTSTLDVSGADESALLRLLDGKKVRLRQLFQAEKAYGEARARAAALRRRFLLFEEEQGLEVGRLACGLLDVPSPSMSSTRLGRGQFALFSPLVLRPLKISASGAAEADLTLECVGDPELNPILLYALQEMYGIESVQVIKDAVDQIFNETDSVTDQVMKIFTVVADPLRNQGLSVDLRERVVAGAFSFDKLAMVDDLKGALSQLAANDVVAACAGVDEAQAAIRKVRGGDFLGCDKVDVASEYLVLDADSSQQRAIYAVLTGGNVVIDGPPGTGKSQTIANLIAELTARGKKVLFVAEKLAAIQAVVERLQTVDLGHVVLDLHDSRKTRRQIARQLAEALKVARRQTEPFDRGTHRRLTERRAALAEYVDELHKDRQPWGISAYDAMVRLAPSRKLDQHGTHVPRAFIDRFDQRTRELVREALARFAADDGYGWRWKAGQSVWSNVLEANDSTARDTAVKVDGLAGRAFIDAQAELAALLQRAGLRTPQTFEGWQDVLRLLDDVRATLERFGEQVFGDRLDDWRYAVAPRQWRRANRRPIGFWQRRRLVRDAREACGVPKLDRDAVFAGFDAAVSQRTAWRERSISGSGPAAVRGLREALSTYETVRTSLAAVAAFGQLNDVDSQPAEQLQVLADRMYSERDHLLRLPELTALATNLGELGLAALLASLAEKSPSADEACAEFERAWLRTFLDEVRFTVPALGRFAGDDQSRIVGEFRKLEMEHHYFNQARVRFEVARRLRQARDAHPEQSERIEKEAAKKARHKPLRRLVEENAEVLLALHPCWAMSPLVVSRALPPRELFDVVIFDEASQVRPQEAVTSIMRGKQLVIAGDECQLPPTNVFERQLAGEAGDEDEDDPADDFANFESILSVLRPVLRNERLVWHYRSQDERLIAFSNEEIYDRQLVTFPGRLKEPPVVLHTTKGTPVPGEAGSTVGEIEKVTDLVLDHARTRPGESLGVIAFGSAHADRIVRHIDTLRKAEPELDPFFSEDRGVKNRFFVKSIETVQGDERDVIVLSLGYATNATGRASMHWGPLNNEGGERRLNVAVTRARRKMHVVSSISPGDFDPSGSKHRGPKLLHTFLQTAGRGGSTGSVEGPREVELNAFEQEVYAALGQAGVPAVPQWGVGGYRIDFALAHSDRHNEYVLAVETDGASYHSRPSARDRDRLRQDHLERLGWRFYRLWSTAWYSSPERETLKLLEAWQYACSLADAAKSHVGDSPPREPSTAAEPADDSAGHPRGPCPLIGVPRQSIADFSDPELRAVVRWLFGDRLQLSREERLDQLVQTLGFQRKGSKIRARLEPFLDLALRQQDSRGR
ncbi:AAA domain-containing protein [Flindersiella endophytica]